MKKLLLAFVCLWLSLLSTKAEASIALVTSLAQGSANQNGFTSSAVDTTGSTLIIAAVAWYAALQPAPISDSKGNTWTSLTQQVSANTKINLYYCSPCTVGTGHTFTIGNSSNYPSLMVFAFSGTVTTAALDQQNGATTSSGAVTSFQPGSVTPAQGGEVVISAIGVETSGSAPTINSGFISPISTNGCSGNCREAAASYLIQTSSAAENPTWSMPSSVVLGSIGSFKSASAPVAPSNMFFQGAP